MTIKVIKCIEITEKNTQILKIPTKSGLQNFALNLRGVRICMAKGGKGVFKAELRAAEVDPRFKICLTELQCHKSK